MAIKSYDSYTSQFNSPYNFSGNVDVSGVSNLLLQRMQEERIKEQQRISGRSMVDRAFDGLLSFNYASAGFADGLVKGSLGTAFKQMGKGFRAGNPFGAGHSEDEYSYSRVLEDAGWKPTSLAGKIAKGAIGFTGDVLLDPTTYLTGGASAIIKGTGRVGKAAEGISKIAKTIPEMRAANTVEKLVGKGVSPELAQRFATKKLDAELAQQASKGLDTHMTQDMATEIVKRQSLDRGFKLTDKEIASDATKFAEKYNKLAGIRDVDGAGKAITFGIENLPFGDKLAPKLGVFGNTLKISDGATARALGDKLKISSAYSGLRDKIYGKKIGELFSNNAKLYQLGKSKPEELYAFVKFIETTKGQSAEKIGSDKAIRDMAKSMQFTPAESGEILKLLEDKTIWGQVKNHLRFAETQKAKDITTSIVESIGKGKDDIDEILRTKDVADTMRTRVGEELTQENSMYKSMQDTYRDEVTKIDLNSITDKAKKQAVIDSMRAEARTLDTEIESLKVSHGVDPKQFDELVRLADEEKVKFDEHMQVRQRISQKKEASQAPQPDSGRTVKQAKQTPIDHETIGQVINKSIDDEKFAMIEQSSKAANNNLINQLSKYVYGEEGKLMTGLRGDSVTQLVDQIKKGKSPDDLAKFIEDNAHIYSEHAKEVYRYLAKKYSYKTWDEAYHKPMDVLRKKLELGDELTGEEFQQYVKLQTLSARRSADFNYLFKRNSFDSFKNIRLKETNADLLRELNDTIDIDREVRRATFNDHDYALVDEKTGKDMRYADQMEREAPKQAHEIITGTNHINMFNAAIEHFVNAENLKARSYGIKGRPMSIRNPLTDSQLGAIQHITKNMEDLLLENFKGKSYADLSRGQQAYLMNMAIKKNAGADVKLDAKMKESLVKESQRREGIARLDAIVDTVKPGMEVHWHDGKRMRAAKVEDLKQTEGGTVYTVKVKDETHQIYARDIVGVRTLNKKVMTPEDLIKASPVAQQAIEKRTALLSEIERVRGDLSQLDGKAAKEKKQLFDFFKVRAEEQQSVIRGLEESHVKWTDTYQSLADDTRIGEIEARMKHYEDALASDDALEIFVKQHMGDKYMDDVLHDANVTHSARIALDDMSSSERVKRWTQTLYESFNKIGLEEVGIGKLKMKQFEEMLGRYVPHILTEDGRKYIDSIKELEEHSVSISRDLGYGLKWNPFSQSRTIDGTISEANAYFAEALQGKNLFNENIADIFVTRALKHNELMYDNEYMNTMMHTFGRVVTDGNVEEGYKAVANYGQLKETISKVVRAHMDEAKSRGVQGTKELWDTYTKKAIRDMELPANILDKIATPMVELNGNQIAKLQEHGIVHQVSDVIVDKANQSRKLQIAKDQSRFLQMYDKFLHWTKLMQTTVMPSFHVRNKASNMYLNWLGVGADAVNPKMQKNAWDTVWHLGDAEKLKHKAPLVITRPNGVPGVIHWNELYELAKTHGVIDEGFFAKDIGAGAASKGVFKSIPSKFDPTDTENFGLFKKGAEWGTRIENSDRLIHFASQLKNGLTVEQAAESSKKFLFDYSDLTAFEQNTMKRIIPYYTWLRKNGKLQVEQLVEQPGKYRDTAKVMSGINNMNGQDERVNEDMLSSYARDWIQTPFSSLRNGSSTPDNPDGIRNPIMANPNLPFMDLGRLPNPFEPIQSAMGLLSQTSPLIKVPAELAANRSTFFGDKIVGKDDNPVTTRLAHIARQLALYNAGEGVATKTGIDGELHMLNSLTGLKGVAYDEQTQMAMARQRLLKKQQEEAAKHK